MFIRHLIHVSRFNQAGRSIPSIGRKPARNKAFPTSLGVRPAFPGLPKGHRKAFNKKVTRRFKKRTSTIPFTKVLETGRLVLRWFEADDAEFLLRLVNDPSWLRFIGDKGVRTLDDARRFLEDGPIAMCRRLGFGTYLVTLREGGGPVGVCGLIKRESLDDVDLGFAFLPEFRRRGYAFESASAVMAHAARDFGLSRVVAITSPDNHASAALLEKLGFRFERMARLSPDQEEVRLHAAVAAVAP